MSFLQSWMLFALPLVALPVLIHLINQWRYQTKSWGAMQFLLTANQMNRGFAKLRQWLILAMRTLAVAGLLFAIARPLASGLLGWTGGGRTDTTIVLMDRSPSMQVQGAGGLSKLETGRQQLAAAFEKLQSEHWVAVDGSSLTIQEFENADDLMTSSAMKPSDSSSDLLGMLQTTLDFAKSNSLGPTEVWICSDLSKADWNSDSSNWSIVRDGFANLPLSVRFHLLAYPTSPADNVSLQMTAATVKPSTMDDADAVHFNTAVAATRMTGANELQLSFRISRDVGDSASSLPVTIDLEGSRSVMSVELSGEVTEVRNQSIPLPPGKTRGWGQLTIPADKNNADNSAYFVYSEPPLRRVVVVSDDRQATFPLEVAAAVSPDGEPQTSVEVVAPDRAGLLDLNDTALLVWHAPLPSDTTRRVVESFVKRGGQLLVFPASSSTTAGGFRDSGELFGVQWGEWTERPKTKVESWRGDQDLFASTMSGAGLPLSQIEWDGFMQLKSSEQLSNLATFPGGAPFIAKRPTSQGSVYFFTASTSPAKSNLAENGIVLFVAVQRAIEQGQLVLGNTLMQTARPVDESTAERSSAQWRQLAGDSSVLSTEFPTHSGVYQVGEERLLAVNRSEQEDEVARVPDERIAELFDGLRFSRVDETAGNLAGIVREIWRTFLILMILAMLIEAALCLPRVSARRRVASA